MNQEHVQNVFIGLLVAGLILLGGGMYLISQQVGTVATSVQMVEQRMMEMNNLPVTEMIPEQPTTKLAVVSACEGSTSATFVGLCYDYPSGWYLEAYQDEFHPANKNLRIASAPGRLFSAESSGGPGTPGVTYFQEGYQIDIKPITLGEPKSLLGPARSGYANLYAPKEACDGAGCPRESYFFYDPKHEQVFEIHVNYTTSEVDAGPLVDTILRSLTIEKE